MKKVNTAAKQSREFSEQKLTIDLDLGIPSASAAFSTRKKNE